MVYLYAFLTMITGAAAIYLSSSRIVKTISQGIMVFFVWVLFLIFGFLCVRQANNNFNLRQELNYLYEINQVEKKCGIFTGYNYYGARRINNVKRLKFTYYLDDGMEDYFFVRCDLNKYQACSVQHKLNKGEGICITYVERPMEKYHFLYEIQRIN